VGYVDFKKTHGLVVDIIVRVNRRKLLFRNLDIRKVYDMRSWDYIENWASEVANLALGALKTEKSIATPDSV